MMGRLEEAQQAEKQHLADKAAWQSLSPALKKEFVRAAASAPPGEEPSVAAWAIQQRLQAGGAPAWAGEVALARTAATPAARAAVNSWLQRQAADVARMRERLQKIPLTRDRAEEARRLEQQIERATARLAKAERLDEIESYRQYALEAGEQAAAADDTMSNRLGPAPGVKED